MSREFKKENISVLSILISLALFLGILFIPGLFPQLEPASKKTIALAVLMISLWITEAIPIPVTAMLPAAFLPLMGIMPFREALIPYINPVVILFFGGFVLAISLEKYNIHNRIAYYLIDRLGTSPSRVIAGFMVATSLLSLWISNTSTAVIMFPIAMSVITLMSAHQSDSSKVKKFGLGLMLAIAYAANIGGSGTLVGTPVNALMVGMLDEFAGIQLGFGSWMLLGIPFVIVTTIVAWFILTRLFFRVGNGKIEGMHEYILKEQKKLGRIHSTEKRIFLIFGLTAILWIFRSYLVQKLGFEMLSDALIALLAAILLFIVPGGKKKNIPILVWADASKIPWGILILFGGGLSLANGLYHTGVIDMIGERIAEASHLSVFLITAITVSVMLFLTEVIGGTPLSSVLFPVIIGAAAALDLSAAELIIPMALAGNAAFMLPMGTPPNAIVFASGYLKVKDMVRVGWLMNIITILIILSLGRYLMQFV